MNTIGIALVWCVVQVTLIGLLAAGLYLAGPAAASGRRGVGRAHRLGDGCRAVALGAESLAAMDDSRAPLSRLEKFGQGVRAAADDRCHREPRRCEDSSSPRFADSHSPSGTPARGAGGEGRRHDGDAVSIKDQPSGAAILWQALLG